MECAWKELLGVLPPVIAREVDKFQEESLREIRLRLDSPIELLLSSGSRWLSHRPTGEDLSFLVNAASRYSPWAASTMSKGFLTGPGGHRIGLCGDAVVQQGKVTGIRTLTSACIRIARDIPGIASVVPDGSLVILGAPGWGKTTLLRDLIRHRSKSGSVGVVDERGELFPIGFSRGERTDVLTGCGKTDGISMLIRTMSPVTLAVDEITESGDTQALLEAHGCGVTLLATAHAASVEDFRSRVVYDPLVRHKVFHRAVVLHSDRQWHWERMA